MFHMLFYTLYFEHMQCAQVGHIISHGRAKSQFDHWQRHCRIGKCYQSGREQGAYRHWRQSGSEIYFDPLLCGRRIYLSILCQAMTLAGTPCQNLPNSDVTDKLGTLKRKEAWSFVHILLPVEYAVSLIVLGRERHPGTLPSHGS